MGVLSRMTTPAFIKFLCPSGDGKMDFIMRSNRGFLKIGKAISQAIPIIVMNKLFSCQLAAQLLLHKKTMLIHPNIGVGNFYHPINTAVSRVMKASATYGKVTRIILTACCLAYSLFAQGRIAAFALTRFTLARIPKCVSILSSYRGNRLPANATRFYQRLCPANRSTHNYIIHQQGGNVKCLV